MNSGQAAGRRGDVHGRENGGFNAASGGTSRASSPSKVRDGVRPTMWTPEVKAVVLMGSLVCACVLYAAQPCPQDALVASAGVGDAKGAGLRTAAVVPRPTVSAARVATGASDLDKCSFTAAPHPTKSQFRVVLLSTFPRSGNTWLRQLLHGATQYMDRALSTSPEMMSKLEQMAEFSTCPTKRCAPRTVAHFITRSLMVHPNPVLDDEKSQFSVANPGGINPTPTGVPDLDVCTKYMTLHSDPKWQTTPVSVSVKSHYPSVTVNERVERFTENVSLVVHTVRNPFDNIASRFLGNRDDMVKKGFAQRFNRLQNARKRNETTEAFNKFVEEDVARYVEFHEYWLARRTHDAARGISTLYTRYESLCENTKDVAAAVAEFGGWNIQWPSFKCVLASQPCSVAGATFPQHIDLFTDDQIDRVIAKTAHLFVPFGYQFNLNTKRIKLVTPKIPMCNGI